MHHHQWNHSNSADFSNDELRLTLDDLLESHAVTNFLSSCPTTPYSMEYDKQGEIPSNTQRSQDLLSSYRRDAIQDAEAMYIACKEEGQNLDVLSVASHISDIALSRCNLSVLLDTPILHQVEQDGSINMSITRDNLYQVFLSDTIHAMSFPLEGNRNVTIHLQDGRMSIKDMSFGGFLE